TSSPLVLTLANNQPASLSSVNIATTGDYLQSNNCPRPISPGAICSIQVSFKPTVVGSIPGALTVSTASGWLQTVNLVGTGSGSVTNPVQLSAHSLIFPARLVG